ncbi:MAG TPA: DinB family protein [Ktedonobacterales bacterium]|jgi:hypothetical protein
MDDAILLDEVRTILSTTPGRWKSLAFSLSADLLTRKPLEGDWAALECLHHLIDTERWVFPTRIRALLAGQDFAAFNPNAQGPRTTSHTPMQLAAEFARRRLKSLRMLEQITPAEFSRTARHPSLGQVTLREMLHTWAAHDLMHTVQAERALMQPFIAGCGPWHVYFTDHIAKAKEQ